MARKNHHRNERGKTSSQNKSSVKSQTGRGIKEERTVFIIVCEGETEQHYFKELSIMESETGIRIKPELANKSNWESILNNANKEHIDQNTKVYYAIDLDCIINQNQMINYIQEKEKLVNKDVIPLETYVCFETWLLFHYQNSPQSFNNCGYHETDLTNFIPNYQKGLREVYSITKSKLQQACVSAERSCKIRDKQIKSEVSQESKCRLCFSDVWKLFRDIGLYKPITKMNNYKS